MQPIDINIRKFGDGFTAQITNRNLPGGNGPGQQVTQHIGTTVAEIVGKLTKDLAALPETYPVILRTGTPAPRPTPLSSTITPAPAATPPATTKP